MKNTKTALFQMCQLAVKSLESHGSCVVSLRIIRTGLLYQILNINLNKSHEIFGVPAKLCKEYMLLSRTGLALYKKYFIK